MSFPALVDVTCKQVVELMGDYLGNHSLRHGVRARLEQHFFACSWCMDYLHQLQGTQRAMRALSDAGEAPLLAIFRRTISAPPPVEGVRHAFKFLISGGRSPIAHFRWPKPGTWVQVEGRVELCRHGVHACTTRMLSSWLHDELWLVQLGGDVRTGGGGLVASHGRLVREVESWRLGGAACFAQAAHDHAEAQVESAAVEARDAARPCVQACAAHLPKGNTALAAFCAAMSIARLRGIDHFDQLGYDAERRWQSRWLQRELALDALTSAHE